MSAPPDRNPPSCFKAYDIRGAVPDEINPELTARIVRAYVGFLKPGKVAVGYDARLSGPDLAKTVEETLTQHGVDVIALGTVATEELYFATASLGLDGGIMITASHNPRGDNGFKLVRSEARPISSDSGLHEIGLSTLDPPEIPSARLGRVERIQVRSKLAETLVTHYGTRQKRPFRIVANAGNGMAGPLIRELAAHLPFEWIWLHEVPDGRFPHGVPNPLLPENRSETAQLVHATGADLGLAWDGDADRCFFYDETGRFIESYYLVGLIASSLLAGEPGAAIVHDPRLVWNTRELVSASGGRPIVCKSGHAFIKESMRTNQALYGGEMSGHHYFRDFFFCDSGMIPWLVVTRLMAESGMSLSQLVEERMARFPISGEINRSVQDPGTVLEALVHGHETGARSVDRLDGLSVEYDSWRFNVRASNTEPLLRINLEARDDPRLLVQKTSILLREIEQANRSLQPTLSTVP